jgi:hypothetical protein
MQNQWCIQEKANTIKVSLCTQCLNGKIEVEKILSLKNEHFLKLFISIIIPQEVPCVHQTLGFLIRLIRFLKLIFLISKIFKKRMFTLRITTLPYIILYINQFSEYSPEVANNPFLYSNNANI